MMKTLGVLLGLSLAAVSGCQSACVRPAATSGAQQLLQADRDFAALADRIGDADAFYAYMTDLTIELPADKAVIQGRIAIRDRLPIALDTLTCQGFPGQYRGMDLG